MAFPGTLPDDLRTLLERLETSLRGIVGAARERVPLGAFSLYLHPSSPSYLLSLAVPEAEPGGAASWEGAVAELLAVFAERGRRPRLEFVAELHPDLPAALERAGLRCEMRARLMTLRPGDLESVGLPAGIDALAGSALGPRLGEFLRAQARAYDSSAVDEATNAGWLPLLRQGLASGRTQVVALLESDVVVAGASLQRGGEGWELAGVFAVPERRGRGLAAAACSRLLSDWRATEPDGLVWLSAAEGAQGLYRRLGFSEVGHQLNYGLDDSGR